MDSEELTESQFPSKVSPDTSSQSVEKSNQDVSHRHSADPSSSAVRRRCSEEVTTDINKAICDLSLDSTSNAATGDDDQLVIPDSNDIQAISDSDISDGRLLETDKSVEVDLDDVVASSSLVSVESNIVDEEHAATSPTCSNFDTQTSEKKSDSVPKCESSKSQLSLPSSKDTDVCPNVINKSSTSTDDTDSKKVGFEKNVITSLQSEDDSQSSKKEPGASSSQESVYYVKWIHFDQDKVPIITQNDNGPCPLLALMNVLLLKGKVKLAPMLEMITSEQLMTYLGECILDNMPEDLSDTTRANYEQNMQDAMAVMYKLQTGLDVNVKFTGVGDFEYTSESTIFDLLSISLYHGWLVDPQDEATVKAVNTCSYNQLVERVIEMRGSQQEEDVTHALVAEQFLHTTASQLTHHGLCELSSQVKDKELCVFFRNNHFNTLYKHNEELFLLVTDQGFLTERNVVWETLSNVDGDCHFVDASFRTYTKPEASSEPIPESNVAVGSPEQIDFDHQLALSLQEEGARGEQDQQNNAWKGDDSRGGVGLQQDSALAQTDLEFALRLQEEENRMARAEQQQMQQQQQQSASRGTSDSGQGQGRGAGSAGHHGAQRRDRRERRDSDKEEKNCCIL